MDLRPGATHDLTWTVTPEKTADAMGNRGVHVFATPWVVALLEQVCGTMIAPHLPPGASTVGTMVEMRHLAATPVGMEVRATATLLETDGRRFLVVDAAMNDLIRPSLYGSYHAIIPVHRVEGVPSLMADVVGPICESGDFLAKDRELPAVQPGDLLAVMSAGAYGFTMASNYNARPRLPEILGKGDRYLVIRRRETYEDLIRGEEIPEDL